MRTQAQVLMTSNPWYQNRLLISWLLVKLQAALHKAESNHKLLLSKSVIWVMLSLSLQLNASIRISILRLLAFASLPRKEARERRLLHKASKASTFTTRRRFSALRIRLLALRIKPLTGKRKRHVPVTTSLSLESGSASTLPHLDLTTTKFSTARV